MVTGSSFIVLVSFVWGIFVFDERVHSRVGACFAIFSMMMGLLGMSYYSSPESAAAVAPAEVDGEAEPQLIQNEGGVYQGLAGCSDDENAVSETGLDGLLKEPQLTQRTTASTAVLSDGGTSFGSDASDHSRSLVCDDDDNDDEEAHVPMDPTLNSLSAEAPNAIVMVDVWGYQVRKRTLGMWSAAFCGIWGGSIMAPMKFCKSDTKGTHYLMSFSIGASIVTLSLWLFRYIFYASRLRSFSKGYAALPSFHLRTMWLAGGTSGLLWSIGNFFSLISVNLLGEGVGYPLVQTSILIAGLWGIFFFKEVQGRDRIASWLMSALLTIFGILLLSYEHLEK